MFLLIRLIAGICTLAVGLWLYKLDSNGKSRVLGGRFGGLVSAAGKTIGSLCIFVGSLLLLMAASPFL